MSLGGKDLTEPIAKSGAQVLRLTGFFGDDQRLHGDGRPFARASRDYRIENITGTKFSAPGLPTLQDDLGRSRMRHSRRGSAVTGSDRDVHLELAGPISVVSLAPDLHHVAMPPALKTSSPTEVLAGLVERVTFHNE